MYNFYKKAIKVERETEIKIKSHKKKFLALTLITRKGIAIVNPQRATKEIVLLVK